MIAFRSFAVVLSAATAVAAGQPTSVEELPPQGSVNEVRESPPDASSDHVNERDALREEFIQARSEFARVTAEALTSQEATNWVRGLSRRVRVRRTEEDLRDVRAALDSLKRNRDVDPGRAERLAQREAELSRDVEQLRADDVTPAGGGVTPADGITMPDQATVRHWVEREMSEETSHLADTLSDRELARRTRRLDRLASLAQFARRIELPRRGPQAIPQNVPPDEEGIVPAGGVEMRPGQNESADFSDLGQPTTVPPDLGEPGPQKGTAGPSDLTENEADKNTGEPATPRSPKQ